MDTNSFWKGEAGVVGLVEDQAHTFKTKLYLKNGQVKDYSCTCEKGNSYRGICAHGEALFAYYKEYQAEMSKPLVHSSSQVHTMIREYTNQEVARILEEEEGSQVKLVPAVILNGRDVRLEFKVGREKMYAVRDLAAFSDAVAVGAYVEYGKELAFHHQGSSFCPECRGLLSLVMALTEGQKSQRDISLSRMNRERFFEVLQQEELEVQLPGGIRSQLKVQKKDPKLVIRIRRYGRDGVEAVLEGVRTDEEGDTEPVLAFFRGERRIYIVTGKTLCCCSHHFSQAAGTFLEQITKEREHRYSGIILQLSFVEVVTAVSFKSFAASPTKGVSCKMENNMITFNDLPMVVAQLRDEVMSLKSLLTEQRSVNNAKAVDTHVPMSVDEAAEYLGIPKGTLYMRLSDGTIPATKPGKRYCLYRDELDKWLESSRKNPVPLSDEELSESISSSHRRKPNERNW